MNIKYKTTLLTISFVILSVFRADNFVYGNTLLDIQTENHFKKYLEERNRFAGIQQLGGPFLRGQYSKTTEGTITTYTYDRPLGILGDPNQIQINTYTLSLPINVKTIDITSLENLNVHSVISQKTQDINEFMSEIHKLLKESVRMNG